MKTDNKSVNKSIFAPICDFVDNYKSKPNIRLHMPGHKGKIKFGEEDITEIDGADSLYEANGIIAESEQTAGKIFGAKTFYSCEGSSLSIRAMVRLISQYAYSKGENPLILAGRNAHKSFISAIALLGVNVEWLFPNENENYLSCTILPDSLAKTLDDMTVMPTAVYITSPDYLGNVAEIKKIASVCHRRGVLLAVDNAHGAYLKFLNKSLHPIDLGADICADSAHKTLPALTGAAYLHVSHNAPNIFFERAKEAMALFGSTSPSYLILQSLDRLNLYLAGDYAEKLNIFCTKLSKLKEDLLAFGFALCGNEPLKITVSAKTYGYTGKEVAALLTANGIYPEFYDDDYITMMFTPEISDAAVLKLKHLFLSIPKKTPIIDLYPRLFIPRRAMTPTEALSKNSEEMPVSNAEGRVLAANSEGCPPAVPILVAGEVVDKDAINALLYYGTTKIKVIK